LSRYQLGKIKQTFDQFDLDHSGDYVRDEFLFVFRKMFHPDISMAEVDGFYAAWGSVDSASIDIKGFTAIISHFVREHEQDWNLLNGFRQLMGDAVDMVEDCVLTRDMLVEHSAEDLLDWEAEEMLWAADWRQDGKGNGNTLELADVMAAILLEMPQQGRKLPPKPRSLSDLKCTTSGAEPSTGVQPIVPFGVNEYSDQVPVEIARASQEAARLVVDLRDMQKLVTEKLVSDVRGGTGADMPAHHAALSGMTSVSKILMPETSGISGTSSCTVMHRAQAAPYIHASRQLTTREAQDSTTLEDMPNTWRAHVHVIMEYPGSSHRANILSLAMGVMIVISVMTLVLEPLISHGKDPIPEKEKQAWFVLEMFFTVVFTFEFLLRLAVATALETQTTKGFLKSPSNICDLIAVLPFYIEVSMQGGADEFRLLRIPRLMRLSRVMKIARLSRRSSLFGPVAMVMTLIWGIYLKTEGEEH